MTTSKQLNRILLILLLGALFPHAVFAADREEKASDYYEDALVRMQHKDTAGAILQLKNALQQDSKMLPALVLLGKAYLESGAPLGAERVLADAERLGADRSQIIAMQAETYNLLGRNQALLERFSPEGLPSDVKYKVLVTRAYAQIDLGQMPAAIQSLEQARKIAPDKPSALVALATAYLRRGNFPDAAAMAQLAVTKTPADPSCWNMKGSVAHAQGNVQEALAGYGKALALKPDYLDALIARASLLFDLNRNNEAVRDVAVLKQKFPGDPRSAYLQALLAGWQGKDTEARNALVAAASALDALPFEAVKTRPQLLLLGGIAHYSLGQNEKAKIYLGSYLNQYPRHVGAGKIMAAILTSEKDYTGVITILEGPAKTRPNDPQALSMLATAYMALGQHAKAVSLLEQASSMSGGGTPDITANFGLSLIGSGQEAQGVVQLQKAYAENPGHAYSGLPLAILYLKQSQSKPAIQILQAVTRNEPRNLTALNLLGVAQGLSKDLVGARKTYGLVLEKSPGFIPAKLNLARLDRYEGKPEDARRRLLAILKDQPKNLDALYELAQLELAARRPQDAVRWLEKARSFNPQSLRPGLMLVDVYLGTGDVQKALDIAKDIQAANRDNLFALAALGRSYLAIGNRGLARENFKRMTQLAGFDADWQQRTAGLQIRAGDYEGARYSLDKALLSKPGYLPALLLKADLERLSGNLDAADKQGRALAAQYPREAAVQQLLGDVAIQRQRWGDAISAYGSAYDLEKNSEHAIGLYSAYSRSGNNAKALAFIQSWVGSNPADPVARRALAGAYVQAGQLDMAQQQYETLNKLLPNDASVYNDLAYIMLKRRQPGALAMAEKAYQLAPGNANVADTLGWAWVEAGEVRKGLRYLREAKIRAPTDPEVRDHLAEALKRAGAAQR
ncbi:MAG: PEP-CTERM system TPR-repeat protein PrsT [Hydrogenophilales bacterium]|nr:PEP-CTERM system TPR-repeat protein PrsT [Hydrogenophilales bacterium]